MSMRNGRGKRVLFSSFWVVLSLAVLVAVEEGNGQPFVPAIISFGDSAVDVGNNDYISTIFKANYLPYGREFTNHKPTGRFCNGKLAADIVAETLGFTTYPPAYLSPQASGKTLLTGANFASAGAGYDEKSPYLSHAIPLSRQLEYFKQYQGKLSKVAGRAKAKSILKGALYFVGAGTSDFIQNYYINPNLNKVLTPDKYASNLSRSFSNFIRNLYNLGARRIGVTSLPAAGCLPAVKTLFGFHHQPGCLSNINADAQVFNKKINAAAAQLKKQLPGLKLVVFDVYQPYYDLVQTPQKYGFAESRRGCCGSGRMETTPAWFLCNPKSIGTCRNATQYVFWDSIHPSQAANRVLADQLIVQGIELVA